jgi:hypothetical protein
MTATKHRAHEWHPIRELRTPNLSPRHADSIVTRLGAHLFDVDEFKNLLYDMGPGNPYRGGAGR